MPKLCQWLRINNFSAAFFCYHKKNKNFLLKNGLKVKMKEDIAWQRIISIGYKIYSGSDKKIA